MELPNAMRMANRIVIVTLTALTVTLFAGNFSIREYHFKYGKVENDEIATVLDDMKVHLTPMGVEVEFETNESAWEMNGISSGKNSFADNCDDHVFEGWPTKEHSFETNETKCTTVKTDLCPFVLGCMLNENSNGCVKQEDTHCTGITDENVCTNDASQSKRSRPCVFKDNKCENGGVDMLSGDELACDRPLYNMFILISGIMWVVLAFIPILLNLVFGVELPKMLMQATNLLALAGHLWFLATICLLVANYMEEDTESATFAAVRAAHWRRNVGGNPHDLEVEISNTAGSALLLSSLVFSAVSTYHTLWMLPQAIMDRFEKPLYAQMMELV